MVSCVASRREYERIHSKADCGVRETLRLISIGADFTMSSTGRYRLPRVLRVDACLVRCPSAAKNQDEKRLALVFSSQGCALVPSRTSLSRRGSRLTQ